MSIISGSSGFHSSVNSANAAQAKAKSSKASKTAKPVVDLPSDKASISGAKSSAVKALTSSPMDGAEEIPGLFKLLRKDDKVFFSIKPDQLNKPFFFSANISKSIGEKRLVGSELGSSQLAEFRKVGNQVQLVAIHTENFAEPGTPQAKFVSEDYADSLLSSAAATPTKEGSEEVLVDASSLLFTDIPGYQNRLYRAYGTTFSLDTKNTNFSQVDNSESQTSFGVQAHYQAPSNPAAIKNLPSTTPVPGSVLTEFRYNFLKLPDSPMTPRLADDRIGHFATTRKDYTGDVGDGKVRYVNRWRLDKKDPDAPMSEPVKPITYWIANDVPEKYREAVKEGVLEWNKAFAAIGFKNAIEVKQQGVDAKFDTLDAAHASVNWYTAADVGSAVGPSHVDPRSGEILDADIRMADVFGRSAQKLFTDLPTSNKEVEEEHDHGHDHGDHSCQYQALAGTEQFFAGSLLEARGDGEGAQKLANAYIKDVVMHEVGHTLGLRHNFRGSTVFTPEQLQDAEFTKENGLGSTVMDYHPFNLATAGEKQGEFVMSTLGAYDYLAIKYAYEPLDTKAESNALADIALQTTTNPLLAYESDEAADASDPGVNRFDLGNDPLGFAGKQVRLGRELWERAQTQELPDGTPYQQLTGAFASGLNKVAGAARFMTRYVGGVTVRRDHAGTGNAIHEPVAADKQREALAMITETLFQPDSFKFKPEFVSRLAKDRFETWGDQNIHVGQNVLAVQAKALDALFDGEIAERLIDNHEKLPEGSPEFRLSELYETLQNTIWSELPQDGDISQGRRDLQREYVKDIVPFLESGSNAPGEARSLMRYMAGQLQKQIDGSLEGKMSLERRAHLDDCSQTIARALNPNG